MTTNVSTDDDRKRLAAYACRLGSLAAIRFAEFEKTLKGLDDADVKFLKRAWVATADLAAGDAGLEIHILRTAICRLRDELRKE